MKNHPLFETDADVGFIHVTRFEATGQKWCARLFAAEELPGLEELHAQFGGGNFELKARGPDKRHIVAVQKIQLDGRPKPLNPEPEAAQPQAMHAAPSGESAMLPLMMQWMQMQQAAATEANRQQSQLMIALISGAKQDAQSHVQAMGQQYAAFAAAQSSLMEKLLVGATSKEAGGVDTFLKGIEFAQEVSAGKNDADAEQRASEDTLAQVLEGAKTFMQYDLQTRAAQGPRNGAAAPPAPAAAPPRAPAETK